MMKNQFAYYKYFAYFCIKVFLHSIIQIYVSSEITTHFCQGFGPCFLRIFSVPGSSVWLEEMVKLARFLYACSLLLSCDSWHLLNIIHSFHDDRHRSTMTVAIDRR